MVKGVEAVWNWCEMVFSPLQTGNYPPADVASGGYVQGMGLFSAMKYFSKYIICTICSSYRALIVRGQRY